MVTGSEPGRLPRAVLGGVSRLVEWGAAHRGAPALHPHGVSCDALLRIRPEAGRPWGVPWLDGGADHPVRMRWSRALGLPGSLPDGLGIALRVRDAGGPDRPLDLLFTSSGRGRRTRHLPLLRRDALGGPYSSLLSYRVGERTVLLTLWPEPARTRLPGRPEALRRALAAGPIAFTLCAAEPGRVTPRPLGTLTTGPPQAPAPQDREAYDPYRHRLPDLHPTARLSRLREVAYTASRAGRGAAAEAGTAAPAAEEPVTGRRSP
ncbi:phosphodiesterase [Streptomyces sp. NPDC053431]|uniref:phosphodiesterase n=1 Tax=Streptomyces sp. NPDC053431 TaxID=3365703 RepID=UPI0037D2439F